MEEDEFEVPLSLGMPPELTTEILSHLNFPHLQAVFCVCRFWASYDADFFYFILLEKNGLKLGTPGLSRPLRWVFQSKFSIPEDQMETFTGIGSAPFYDVGNYEGEWKDGSTHGWGTFFYKTSDGEYNVRYEGEWHEGARQGKGRMVWGKEGPADIYEGSFLGNLFEGEGTFRWRTGDKYIGNWKENKRSGFGTFYWHSGDSYEGLWEDDLKSGEGTLKWKNGNQYQGSWKNELKENGNMYEAASKRSFQADEIDYVINPANLHPLILESAQFGLCTSSVTKQTCYFQYLWQTTESTDRIHGVCVVCKDKCVSRNGYKLRNPNQFYFGGNFFCDCGTGRLGGTCFAHTENVLYSSK